jgi:hypothetical protein
MTEILYNKPLNNGQLDQKRARAKQKQRRMQKLIAEAEAAAKKNAEGKVAAAGAAAAKIKAEDDKFTSGAAIDAQDLPPILINPPLLANDKAREKIKKKTLKLLNKALNGKTEEGAAEVAAFMVSTRVVVVLAVRCYL